MSTADAIRHTEGELDGRTDQVRAAIAPARREAIDGTVVAPTPVDKRVLDIVLSLVLLTVMAPVIVGVALIVRRDGGPVFFAQRRVGQGGRIIRVRKFRSMAIDAEERLLDDPEMHARYIANGFKLPAEDDPRLSRWGRFLRASSLDELPQLVSVLFGDMSMVGPRPVVEPELVEYASRGALQQYLSTPPGLTGLWQVSGRSTVGYDRRVALDVHYIDQRSLRLDLKIVFKTVAVVIRRVGAH